MADVVFGLEFRVRRPGPFTPLITGVQAAFGQVTWPASPLLTRLLILILVGSVEVFSIEAGKSEYAMTEWDLSRDSGAEIPRMKLNNALNGWQMEDQEVTKCRLLLRI